MGNMSWVSRFSCFEHKIFVNQKRKCRRFHWWTSMLCDRCAQYDSVDNVDQVFLSLCVRMFEWYCISGAVYLSTFLNLIDVFLSSVPFLFINVFFFILSVILHHTAFFYPCYYCMLYLWKYWSFDCKYQQLSITGQFAFKSHRMFYNVSFSMC